MLPFAMEWSDGPIEHVSVCCSRDAAELMSINGLTALLCYPYVAINDVKHSEQPRLLNAHFPFY